LLLSNLLITLLDVGSQALPECGLNCLKGCKKEKREGDKMKEERGTENIGLRSMVDFSGGGAEDVTVMSTNLVGWGRESSKLLLRREWMPSWPI